MTVRGGTSPACAACKYQRRKCSSDCPLAPYFPANQPRMFQNVHRLFGVSNIHKILKKLDSPNHKEDAMKSIIYESDMRERFPVYGCSVIIYQLRLQLQHALEELRYVYMQLDACKEQMNKNDSGSSAQLGIGSYYSSKAFQQSLETEMPLAMNQFFGNDQNYGGYVDANDNIAKHFLELDPYCDIMNSNGAMAIQAQMEALDVFGIQQERDISQDYHDIPLSIMPDDRQSYETTGVCESSSESSLKDTMESVEQLSQTELKNAAAYFSLTTIN